MGIEFTFLDETLGFATLSHNGGDEGIIETLYDYLCGTYTGSAISTIEESCEGHLIVFAAEESRKNGNVVDFREYVKSLE